MEAASKIRRALNQGCALSIFSLTISEIEGLLSAPKVGTSFKACVSLRIQEESHIVSVVPENFKFHTFMGAHVFQLSDNLLIPEQYRLLLFGKVLWAIDVKTRAMHQKILSLSGA